MSLWASLHEQDRFDLRYPDPSVVRFLKGRTSRSERVLDVGCGTGRHTRLAFDLGYQRIVGCDVSLPGLKRAYEKLPIPIYQQADTRHLPYRTGTFGILLAVHSLYYGDERRMVQALSECRRVLKPGGVAYIALRADDDWRATLPGESVGFVSRRLTSNDSGEEGMTLTFISRGLLTLLFRPWQDMNIGWEHVYQDGRKQSYWNIIATA